MARMRTAAAILLTRGRGSDREAFLVERSRKLRFFGGYWALPGGVVDAGDRRPADPEPQLEGESLPALERCAFRELFEETGVLPAALRTQAGGAAEEVRGALLDEQEGARARFGEWLDAVPHVHSALTTACSITTPEFAPVRYRTRFLHLELPPGEQPAVVPGELAQGRFFAPREVLSAWRRGEILVAPPVLDLLERLSDGDLQAFFARARTAGEAMAAGMLHRVYFTPGIFVAPLRTPTLPPATSTNCLLVGSTPVQVVDPAPEDPAEQERLAAVMRRWIAAGREFGAILLTHHHRDHVGAVNCISREFDLPVRGHRLTLERLAPGFRAGEPLEDGDRVELGCSPDGDEGWHLEVYHTPGHDRGHLCFVDSRYRAALVGDLVSTASTIVIDPPEGHMATYLASLRRMESLGLKMLHPAHGPIHRDGSALLAHFLQHRQQREEKLSAALRDTGRSLGELLTEVYADVDPELRGPAERSLLAGLQKLEEERRARRQGDTWLREAGPGSGS